MVICKAPLEESYSEPQSDRPADRMVLTLEASNEVIEASNRNRSIEISTRPNKPCKSRESAYSLSPKQN